MKINDWYIGIVEDTNDPQGQGRVRVRCLGYHTPDRNELPTQDLPLATVISPTTSAGIAGIGISATGLVNGSWVFGFFRDGGELQDPVILGSIASASGYDVGYDVTTNMGFGDANGVFSGFTGNDIPVEASTFGGGGAAVTAAANPVLYNSSSNSFPGTSSFDIAEQIPQLNGDVSSRLISTARSQIGVKETSKNQGGGIEKYWSATNYTSGYRDRQPWCAAFACWVIQQSGILQESERPKTASAFGFIDWARGKPYANLRMHPRHVSAGDIVVFSFSHVGIASTNSDANGVFKSIDGNTSDAVLEKTRRLSMLKAAITLAPSSSLT